MQHQLQPQLGGLVLDDEQHLVVMRRHAQGVLGAEDLVQRQVLAVGQAPGEVAAHPGLERSGVVVVGGHGRILSHPDVPGRHVGMRAEVRR